MSQSASLELLIPRLAIEQFRQAPVGIVRFAPFGLLPVLLPRG